MLNSNKRPDEEGIKTYIILLIGPPFLNSNKRPDEEGIKTAAHFVCAPRAYIQTRDLMKKGLRRKNRDINVPLIIQTRDLMKKGLRLKGTLDKLTRPDSNKRPDEEGIKTAAHFVCAPRAYIQTRDLMKKGLRRENTNSSKTKRRMGVGAFSRTSPFQKKFPGRQRRSPARQDRSTKFLYTLSSSQRRLAPPAPTPGKRCGAGVRKARDAVFFVPVRRILTCHEPASFLRRRIVDRGLKQPCCSLSVPISRGASIVPANRRTPWLVCYDIADKSRLQRVHRLISRRAIPFQYSVFYINATRNDIVDMVGEIAICINPHHDGPSLSSVDNSSPFCLWSQSIA